MNKGRKCGGTDMGTDADKSLPDDAEDAEARRRAEARLRRLLEEGERTGPELIEGRKPEVKDKKSAAGKRGKRPKTPDR